MEGLYEWIRNITYYLIFMTVVENLLPNRKYEKYFRLFAGMVLILLVLKPFTGGLRLDDKLAYSFEAISFQKEAAELTEELTGMEGKRLKSMVAQYEAAVETDLKSMADTAGFFCRQAEAAIDGNESHDTFGHVVSVYLLVASGGGAETGMKGGGSDGGISGQNRPDSGALPDGTADMVTPVTPVEPVKVEVGRTAKKGAGKTALQDGGQESDEGAGTISERRQEENSALAVLRRRISEYYDLEERNIEIQLENE